jgi:ectoine hydroxylase
MRMSSEERSAFGRDGYVVRTGVFSPDEVAALRDAVEDVAARVKARALRHGAGPEARMEDGHRIQFSSKAAVQWEWREGSEEIRLIEPVSHLDVRLAALFDDRRLTDPMTDLVEATTVGPFTSKLNLKRGSEGSEFPFHQDYPYWYVACGKEAADIATAMIFLDDASAANGALRVLPGSHAGGPAPRDPDDPTHFLADPKRLDTGDERTVEVPAGSVLLFGSFLVHRSSPNDSGADRRALLLSFQPAGRPRLHDLEYRRELVDELP